MGAAVVHGAAPRLTESEGSLSGTDRLERACEAALGRLVVKEREGTDPDIFNELGEALFWLRALAEANRRSDPVLDGLRWARNRVAHGLLLTAPTAWTYGSELGRMVLGQSMLGTTSGSRWLARSEITAGTPPWSDPNSEAAYDAHIAGQSVLPSLRQGLALAR
jgi:hypothetical protein